MRKVLLLLFLPAALSVQAQRKITVQPSYTFVNGSESNASQYAIDGYYRFPALSVGVGAALDAHYMQSVPVYVATQKIIGKETMRFVVYANGGLNIPALRESQKQHDARFRNGTDEDNYKSGYYYDFGGGFAFALRRNRMIQLTCGLTGKSIKQVYNAAFMWGDYVPPEQEQQHTYTYNLQRIAVRLKLQLW